MTTAKLSKEQALAIADSLISNEKQRLKDSRVVRDEFIRVAQMIRRKRPANPSMKARGNQSRLLF